MNSSVIMPVRIDKKLKHDVEDLYNDLGLTFSMAIKLFAKQSLIEQGLPFTITRAHKAAGSLSKYANKNIRTNVDNSFKDIAIKNYENCD